MMNILNELEELKNMAKTHKKSLDSSMNQFNIMQAKLKQNEHRLTDEQKQNMHKAQDIISKAKKDLKNNSEL